MAKRVLGWFLAGAAIWACGSDDEAQPPVEAPSSEAADELTPTERDVEPVARYRFVETSDGMAVEVSSGTQVQSFACTQRSCAGLCDECAAEACRLSGELGEACQFLVRSCTDTCNCQNGVSGCGFPVCAVDRMICYVGDDPSSPGSDPRQPVDPNPFGPAGRPSESNAARPEL